MRIVAIICIVLGASMFFLSGDGTSMAGYMKIGGFVLLMFGLYKCTKFWVRDEQKAKEEEDEPDDLHKINPN